MTVAGEHDEGTGNNFRSINEHEWNGNSGADISCNIFSRRKCEEIPHFRELHAGKAIAKRMPFAGFEFIHV